MNPIVRPPRVQAKTGKIQWPKTHSTKQYDSDRVDIPARLERACHEGTGPVSVGANDSSHSWPEWMGLWYERGPVRCTTGKSAKGHEGDRPRARAPHLAHGIK